MAALHLQIGRWYVAVNGLVFLIEKYVHISQVYRGYNDKTGSTEYFNLDGTICYARNDLNLIAELPDPNVQTTPPPQAQSSLPTWAIGMRFIPKNGAERIIDRLGPSGLDFRSKLAHRMGVSVWHLTKDGSCPGWSEHDFSRLSPSQTASSQQSFAQTAKAAVQVGLGAALQSLQGYNQGPQPGDPHIYKGRAAETGEVNAAEGEQAPKAFDPYEEYMTKYCLDEY